MPEPEKRDESWMRALVKSRVARVSAGGGAMQASTIGFVLAGSVVAGFVAGSWLDARFKTGFWMPLLTVLGIFGGFYQMLLMLKQIDAAAKIEDAQSKKNRAVKNAKVARTPRAQHSSQSSTPPEITTPKPRIFAVPPPPTASYEQDKTNETVAPQDASLRDDENEKTLTERLLDDDSATPQ